jgi:hypothetical protein
MAPNSENNNTSEQILITPDLWNQEMTSNSHEDNSWHHHSTRLSDLMPADKNEEHASKVRKLELGGKRPTQATRAQPKQHTVAGQHKGDDSLMVTMPKNNTGQRHASPWSTAKDVRQSGERSTVQEASYNIFSSFDGPPIAIESESGIGDTTTKSYGTSATDKNQTCRLDNWSKVASCTNHSPPITIPFCPQPPPSFFANHLSGTWPPSRIPRPVPAFPTAVPVMPGLNTAWPGMVPFNTMLVPYPVPIPIPIPLPIPVPVPMPPSAEINIDEETKVLIEQNIENIKVCEKNKNEDEDANDNRNCHLTSDVTKSSNRTAIGQWLSTSEQTWPDRHHHHYCQGIEEETFGSNSVSSSSDQGTVLDLSSSVRNDATTPLLQDGAAVMHDRRSSVDGLQTRFLADRLVAPPYLARRSLILDAPQVEKQTSSSQQPLLARGAIHDLKTLKRFSHQHRRRLATNINVAKTKRVK